MDPEVFGSLLQTIQMLGLKTTRDKEELLAYHDLLRYARSLSRFNEKLIEREADRLDGEIDNATGHNKTSSKVA